MKFLLTGFAAFFLFADIAPAPLVAGPLESPAVRRVERVRHRRRVIRRRVIRARRRAIRRELR